MKNLVKGFTLAEVLITLSIIGVVASLTLPALSVNITKQHAGAALSKAITTLETANQTALNDMNCRELLCGQGIPNNKPYFAELLSPYLQLTFHNENITYRNGPRVRSFFKTKDGIDFSQIGIVAVTDNNYHTGFYGGDGYFVLVDINGTNKGPNEVGVDAFLLLIDRKGAVIAVGSRAHRAVNRGVLTWENGNCDSRKKAPNQPNTCAGSIVDNGFKVIY